MNTAELDIILIFVIGGGFCLLLVGSMLAFIRKASHGLFGDSLKADLRAEVNSLTLARAALDKNYKSNRISDNDYTAICLDIDRRLLKLSKQAAGNSKTTHSTLRPNSLGIGLAIILPVSTALIYASLGRPDLPDNPLIKRTEEIAKQSQLVTITKKNLAQNLTDARASSIAKPTSVKSWLDLAEAAAAVNDSATEIRALRMAQQLTNNDPAILSLLAEALSRAADGQVTVPARTLIDTVLVADPTDPRALFLWGLAAFQDGDYPVAISRWENLLSISTPDAPWLPLVRRNIQQAAEAGDIILSAETGPDAESIDAAAEMSPEDREAMILSMVEALSSRLETTPNDTRGWLRLARAYDVLGNTDAAFDALAKAAASAPQDESLSYQFLERTIDMDMSAEQLNMAKIVINRLTADDAEGPKFLFFLGHLARLSGEYNKARAAWTKLLNDIPADSEMASALAAEIAGLD